MPYVSFLFICLVWGSSFILMDRASHALGPVSIAVCRLLGGALVLAVFWLWKRQYVGIRLVDWGHILVVAVLANALPFVVQPYTMIQAGEHAYFGMMVALVPLATILISIPMLDLWPTRKELIGVLGGMACMALAVYDGSVRGIPFRLLALGLTVPVTYALGNTYVKWKLDHLPALPMTTLFLAVGGVLLLPLQFSPASLANWKLAGPAQPYDWPVAIASIVFLSAVGTGVAILLFVQLIKSQGPLFAGMVTYVVPVLALFWGQFDKERLTLIQLLAIGGVLAMVAIVQWGAATPSTAMASEPDAA
ncbi:MAG: EamA family transporter [Planctomycetes bacterium]|nr:EamA family transporter [Planctomycetota bacterium]